MFAAVVPAFFTLFVQFDLVCDELIDCLFRAIFLGDRSHKLFLVVVVFFRFNVPVHLINLLGSLWNFAELRRKHAEDGCGLRVLLAAGYPRG